MEKTRPHRHRYEAELLQRAGIFESQANELWNAAYVLERKLAPLSAPPGQTLAERRSGMFDLDVLTTRHRGACFID